MTAIPAHHVIRVGQIAVYFRLDASQTAGHFTMFEFRVPVHARVPVPHSHEAFYETIYGLDGVTSWTVDGHPVGVGPGEVLFIRRGVVHHFENRGDVEARALSVVTPGLLGPSYFREIGEIVNAGGPPDIPRIMAVMQRHGLRPVPPAA